MTMTSRKLRGSAVGNLLGKEVHAVFSELLPIKVEIYYQTEITQNSKKHVVQWCRSSGLEKHVLRHKGKNFINTALNYLLSMAERSSFR